MDMNSAVDVRDVLGAVRVPTLVLHRTGDAMFHVEEARYLAEHIPSAKLQYLDGADHFVSGNPDQILDPIEAFLETVRRPAVASLALAAVVAVARDPGLVDDLVSAGGRVRTTPSGRRVVLFDGPATAVRCGLASLRAGAAIGVSIAEVPRASASVDGPGVRHAERIADTAAPGELWVSAAAGMLLAGSGVQLLPVPSEDDIAGQPLLHAIR
jgi:hypothetical protein